MDYESFSKITELPNSASRSALWDRANFCLQILRSECSDDIMLRNGNKRILISGCSYPDNILTFEYSYSDTILDIPIYDFQFWSEADKKSIWEKISRFALKCKLKTITKGLS